MLTITPLSIKRTQINNCGNYNNVPQRSFVEKQENLSKVSPDLALVSFCGIVPRAKRLNKSDYLISGYIAEIGKARWFHGDKAVIDLSMGNPDLTPPKEARKALQSKVNDLWSHRYNNPKGEGEFTREVADWMDKRFGVTVNPREEVMVTSGSADAVDHIFSAYANYGDKVLVPNPGYSLYDDLITRHDLTYVPYDLSSKNGYLPDFSRMPKDAKILIINYPHNPTGSFAPKEVFEEAVKFAKENKTLIIHDMDNSEVTHSGIKPHGILEIDGAKEVAFQVHTMSKAQSMPGFRVAFAVSDKENIDNLLSAKFLSGGSVYTPVQSAAIAALKDKEGYIDRINQTYRDRKNLAISRLNKLGSDAKATDGTYYLWAKVPEGFTSNEFFKYVIHKSQVALTPGTVFGSNGEGYVRIVMSADTQRLNKAFDQIEKAGIRFDVPKDKLPKELQEEIKAMADGTYSVVPKAIRDYKAYQEILQTRASELTDMYKTKDAKFVSFIPKNFEPPQNILKDGQSVYLQNIRDGKAVFGDVFDIPAFSDRAKYDELKSNIRTNWLKSEYKDKNILNMYRVPKLYEDAYYFGIKSEDGKLQALANLEIQEDGCLWARGLNTAPWNQGKDSELRNCGTSVMARMASFCLETGNDGFKVAENRPENIMFYKKLGMKENGTRLLNGQRSTVLEFDKKGMEEFLNKFSINLSY